jgi:hypothetical protein
MKVLFGFLITFIFFYVFPSCSSVIDTDVTEPNKTTKTYNGIQYTLAVQGNQFSQQDTLTIDFQVRNLKPYIKKLYFTNQPELCFQLKSKSGDKCVDYPNINLPATITHNINPGVTKSFNAISLFKDHNGVLLEKGDYVLTAFLGSSNSPKLKLFISLY